MKVSFTKEVIQNPTPINGVQVESINIVAPLGENTAGPTIDVESSVVTPAAEIPSIPVGTSTALAVQAPAPVAVPDSPIEFDDNDIRFEDVYLPRLNLVHNVGDLMKIFESGDILLNAAISIHTPANPPKRPTGTPPLNITIVGFKRKQYAEKVIGGTGGLTGRLTGGLLVESEQDVVRHGGTLSYKEWEQSVKASQAPNSTVKSLRYFQPYATALLIVEQPAHIPDTDRLLFPYECQGKYYALALWGMKGTAYTHAAKHFFTARKIGHLRNGYLVRSWDLTTKLQAFDSNVTWIPVVRPAQPNSEIFIAFVKNVIGCAGN